MPPQTRDFNGSAEARSIVKKNTSLFDLITNMRRNVPLFVTLDRYLLVLPLFPGTHIKKGPQEVTLPWHCAPAICHHAGLWWTITSGVTAAP